MWRFPFAIFSLREANSNSNQFIFLKFDPPCSRNRPPDHPWNHWNPYQLLEDHPRADGYVVSNYGDRKSPSWGCGTPSKWPRTWLVFAGWSQPRTSPGMMIKPFVRIPVTARKGITNSQLLPGFKSLSAVEKSFGSTIFPSKSTGGEEVWGCYLDVHGS